MLLILLMSKGSKEALTVLIVTHVTHVKRVESGVCGLYTQYTHYRYIQCYVKGSKDYVMLKQGTYTFLLITFLIFNQFSIGKKFWKPYHPMLCMSKGSKVISTFNPFNML